MNAELNLYNKLFLTIIFITTFTFGASVDIFFDASVPGSSFAAQELKVSLEGKGNTVASKTLLEMSTISASTRFVLTLTNNSISTSQFSAELGGTIPAPGEQGFSLRKTTSGGSTTYWDFGGDGKGLLYGGLDMEETIRLDGIGTISTKDARPTILNRGIKFNIPLDARTPGYGDASEISRDNIINMWDISFWHDFLDNLARDRYNVLSLWNLHPFPSMVKVPGYPNVALNDVYSYSGYFSDAALTGTAMYPAQVSNNLVKVKTMTIDEKIAFWKDVMAYGRERGIDFYIFTWNIFTYGADGKDGVTSSPGTATDTYFRKSVAAMVETYPLLAGFGITNGENMQGQTESWLYNVYGQGIMDGKAASASGRKVRLIHRMHQASGISGISSAFSGFNDQLDYSYKYSAAHSYSSVAPPLLSAAGYMGQLTGNSKMWLTLRNDDMYMLRWGDPDFVRAYLKNMPIATGKLAGYYMGSDGYVWGRELISTEADSPRQLISNKWWYSFLLWGRLGYDPNIPNATFQKIIANKFPIANAADLLTAWSAVSKALPLTTRFHWSKSDLDYLWYPEACYSNPTVGYNHNNGFHDVNAFINFKPMGPAMMDIGTYKSKVIGNQAMGSDTTPVQVGNLLNDYQATSLPLIDKIDPGADKELRLTLSDIRAMAYLSKYFGEKTLGAADKAISDANGSTTVKQSAIAHLQNAAIAWRTYATIIGTTYTPVHLTRMGSELIDVRALVMPKVLQDIQIAGGLATMPAMSATAGGTILEAESAQLTGATAKTTISGYTGSGYADFGISTNGSVTWTFNAPTSGRYLLEFRYSLPTGNSTMSLSIGGTSILPALSCWQTGNASSWVWDQRVVNLAAGNNSITLASKAANAPFVDHLNIIRVGEVSSSSGPNIQSALNQPQIILKGTRFFINNKGLSGQIITVRLFSMSGALAYSQNIKVPEDGKVQGELIPRAIRGGSYMSEISADNRKLMVKPFLFNR